MTVAPALDSRPRQLAGIWTLTAPGPNGTCPDVEAVCVAVVDEVTRRWKRDLRSAEWDDAIAHLLGEAHVLHRLYDPAKRHGSGSFAGYLYDRLRYRLIDYWRHLDGKNGFRAGRETPVDFTLIDHYQDDQPGSADVGALRLQQLAGAAFVDREDAVGRLHAAADRVGHGSVVGVGRPAGGRPPLGAAGSAQGAGGPRPGQREGGVGAGAFRDCGACGWRVYAMSPNGKPGWHMPDLCPACGVAL